MYYDYNGNEIEDLEMDNMRRDSREEQRQLTVTFDEARAFLYISDNFGGNIDLNPKQAMELLDFLLQKAEDIRGYITPEDIAQGYLDTAIGQDCPMCPKGDNGHHQYQIKQGCYVEGKPSCEWCARTEEVWGQWQDENAIESVPISGWPPSAQETVHYQEIMAKPDEF